MHDVEKPGGREHDQLRVAQGPQAVAQGFLRRDRNQIPGKVERDHLFASIDEIGVGFLFSTVATHRLAGSLGLLDKGPQVPALRP